ncbi:MAG TPA: DUF3570 domain-containing protein [Polyangia bacterium]
MQLSPPARERRGDLRGRAPVAAACCLLLIIAAPARADVDVEAASHLTVFTEPSSRDSGVRVLHPQTEVTATTGGFGIRAGYEMDAVSGSTPRVYAPADAAGADAVTGATFSDTRHVAHGGLAFETATLAFQGNYSYGVESDYKSHTLSAAARGDFAERNFSLSLAYTHSADSVCDNPNTFTQDDIDRQPLADSVGCFTAGGGKATRSVTIDTFSPSLSWTATPLLMLTGGLSLQVLDGFQSNPYRAVRLGSAGRTPQERLPENRQRYAVFAQATQAIPPVKSAVHLGARLYRDTWDLRALSADAEWRSYFASSLILSVRGRLHSQGSAVFYRSAEGLRLNGPVGQYWTGDRELAPFTTIMAGGGLTFVKTPPTEGSSFYEEIELDARFDMLVYRPEAGAPNADRKTAQVIQAGARIRF